MKHREAREISEFTLNPENQLWCKNEDSRFCRCGSCKSCLCLNKLSETTQWLSRAGGASKWRFLIGILVRCKSVDILESIQKILQVTLGKDFTYARSRQKPSFPEYMATWSSDRALDGKLLRTEMLETWDWFTESKYWTKANYVLGLLSMCDTELLHALRNLIGVLIVKERRSLMQSDSALDDLQDATSSIPESCYSFNPDDHPELELLIRASSNHQALDNLGDVQGPDSAEILQEMNSLDLSNAVCPLADSPRARLEEPGCGGVVMEEGPGNVDTEGQFAEDPTITVVPGSSKSLSGVSRYQDFVRRLPVHLAKRILGLVDKATLASCRHVSLHWRLLTDEIQAEFLTKRMVENQAMIMQGSSSAGVKSVYSKIREVLVPIKQDEKHVASEIAKDRGFEVAYAGIKTRPVEIEEKNMFCGAYNILVLSNQEDSARVAHYSGGQLVAVGSKDRLVRLLDVKTMKERPMVMQGHAGSIRAVHICEERGLVISGGYDLSIRCWNLKTGVCTMLFRGHFGTINCLDLHGNRLVSGAKDCRVKVWNLLTGKCHQRLKFRHDHPIQCVKVTQSLVLSSCDRGQLKMWDVGTGALLKLVDTPQGSVRCLYLDEWHILSGGADGYVMAWSTSCDYNKCLMTYRHPREVLTLMFLFLRVITGCMDGKIRIFDFLTGDCLRVIMSNSQQSPVYSLHICDNNVVLNTRTSVLLFQFGKDSWDCSVPSEGECVEKEGSPKRSFGGHPYSPDCSESSPQMRSSTIRDWKQAEKASLLHHAYSLSTPSMQQAKCAQGSLETATGSAPKGSRPRGAYIDLQPDVNAKPQSACFPGRQVNRTSRRPRTSTISSARESVPLKCDLVKKRRPYPPVPHGHTPSTVNISQQPQQLHQYSCHMHLGMGIPDAWVSPVVPLGKGPRAKTSLRRLPKSATPAPRSFSSSSHAPGQRVHSSPPPVVRPQTEPGFRGHQPLLDPRSKQVPVAYGMGMGKAVRRVGAFTTTAERDVHPDQRMLMKVSHKPLGRQVEFEMPPKPSTAVPRDTFDPFRRRTLFRLLTPSQQEARERDAFLQHQQACARDHLIKERLQRRAWLTKVKGLPVTELLKEG